MSGAYVTSDLEGLAPMLARLNALGNPRRVVEGLANIGGLVESQTRERFETKVSPEGDAWEEWSERYALTRKPGQSLLMATGAYQDSYAWDLTGDALRVGSNMVQAALMNWGGTDDMAPGPAAVPARQQLGLSDDNIRDIEDAMGDWIEGLAQ
jgi:phage virion morphogenesis protein